jgi:hypothetical protein
MATVYTVKGAAALISPFSQRWRRNPTGISHDQSTIYSGNEEIDLSFDSCSITMSRQWLEAASGGSLNLTVLNRYGIDFTDLSAVFLDVIEYPAVENAMSGPFTLVVKSASAA